MKTTIQLPILLVCATLAACDVDAPVALDDSAALASVADDASQRTARATSRFHDPVVGASFDVPADWTVYSDPVLFDDTYGFVLFGSDSDPVTGERVDERPAYARVALVHGMTADDVEGLLLAKEAEYSEFATRREPVRVAGREGTAITGLPGVAPYSVVYTTDGERVFEIGLWGEEDGEISATGRQILAGLEFTEPTRDVADLGLEREETAQYAPLPPDLAALSDLAAAERARQVAMAGRDGLEVDALADAVDPAAAGCDFGQPNTLYWQTQWDLSNTFWRTWYGYAKSYDGWTNMSGNGGSWWGYGYHLRKCNTGLLNQYYANDWPANFGANIYAAFAGKVEWAGWGTDGYYTLGRYVIVRSGGYRSLSAHLNSIAGGVTWGASVGQAKVIGYAGSSGGPWDPHLHARVSYGESLTANGQPYGGQAVWPNRLRCWDCSDYDVKKTGEPGGWYTSFWYERWMYS